MGTRSGDLDPGLLVYLMRQMNLDAGAIEPLVDHGSGLLGISGVGSDMRRLHAAAVRAAVCQGLAWFGVRLDPTRNACAADPISAADSRRAVRVPASQEDAQIARHTARLLVQPAA